MFNTRRFYSTSKIRFRRFIFSVSTSIILLVIYRLYIRNKYYEELSQSVHSAVTKWFINNRKEMITSGLGTRLFKQGKSTTPRNKIFSILIWKNERYHQPWQLNKNLEYDPLENCSVTNCIFTGNEAKISKVDAVVINFQHGGIPKVAHRNASQRWIFLFEKSPNDISLSDEHDIWEIYANVFNWTMSYRSDADIPVPYGRTVILQEPALERFDVYDLIELIPHWHKKRRDILVTVLVTNCKDLFQINFIQRIKNYFTINVFEDCGNNTNVPSCRDDFASDCDFMSEYLFYLASANASCREHLTEEIWYRAYMQGAIPIIIGASFDDCVLLLPPNSYIHVSERLTTNNVKEIARYLDSLNDDDEALLSFHQWRNHFNIINEYGHGYLQKQSNNLCRVCEGMNYNEDVKKIYKEDDLRSFLDPELNCQNDK